jgi:hypothetical protein
MYFAAAAAAAPSLLIERRSLSFFNQRWKGKNLLSRL